VRGKKKNGGPNRQSRGPKDGLSVEKQMERAVLAEIFRYRGTTFGAAPLFSLQPIGTEACCSICTTVRLSPHFQCPSVRVRSQRLINGNEVLFLGGKMPFHFEPEIFWNVKPEILAPISANQILDFGSSQFL